MSNGAFHSQLQDRPEEAVPQDQLLTPRLPGHVSQLAPVVDREALNEPHDQPHLLQAAGAVLGNDFVATTIARDIGRLVRGDYQREEGWNADNDQTIRELFEEYDLPITEGGARRIRGSVSEVHARRIMDRIKGEMENERLLETYFGGDGADAFLFRLGATMFDPAGWVAGGAAAKLAGAGLKGRKLAQLREIRDSMVSMNAIEQQIVQNAALAPVTGRGQYAARSAVATAAADGSLEAYHLSRSPTAGLDDYSLAGLTTLAMGGVFGALGYGGAQRQVFRRAAPEVNNDILSEVEAPVTPREPQRFRVYHGSIHDFDEFQPGSSTGAVYFSQDRSIAERWGINGHIYEADVELDNPLVIDSPSRWESLMAGLEARAKNMGKPRGYIRIEQERIIRDRGQKTGNAELMGLDEDLLDTLERGNHDGIINNRTNEVVVFDASRIRMVSKDGESVERPYDPFAGSSVGSARQRTADETEMAPEEDPLIAQFDPGQGGEGAFGSNIRWDSYASFMRSPVSSIRAFGAMVLEDGAATLSRQGKPQHFSVEAVAHQHERVHTTRFAREMTGAYDNWKKSQGIKTVDSALDRQHFDEFSRKVAMAVRGDPSVAMTPEISRAVTAWRKSMRDQLDRAHEVGLMKDVEYNDLYVPRFWRRDEFVKMIDEFDGETGKDLLANILGKGLVRSLDGDLEKADEIARHMINIITSKSVSEDAIARLANMTPESARGKLRAILGEGAEDETLDSLVQLLSGGKRKDKTGEGPRAERRLDIDETAEITRNGRKYRLADLLNNDLLSINTIYSRQIGGRAAFAEVSGGKFKTNDDFENWFAKMEAELDGLPNNVRKAEEHKIKRLRAYTDYLMGHGSLDDTALDADTQAFLKFMRDVSFARLMGQVAYAQLSEVGTAIGALGLRAFMRQVPSAVRQVMDNYQPGKSQTHDHLAYTLADLTGLGNMHLMARMRTTSRTLDSEDVYGARDNFPSGQGPSGTGQIRDVGEKAGRLAELAARGTSVASGLQFITDTAHLAASQALLVSFARNVKDGKSLMWHPRFKDRDQRRLAMGLDDEWETRISEVLREGAVYDENGILKDLNFKDVEDQQAVDHLLRVIMRETRRIIQEGDLGNTREMMVNPLMRTVLQFKSFVMGAHVKQMLYGANIRDAQFGTEVLMSTIFAGMGQMMKYQLATLGMSGDSREEYLEYAFGEEGTERTTKAILSAIRYSSHVGLLPDAIDTITQHALGERFFDYRNTGLSSGFFDLEASAAYNTMFAPFQPFNELAAGEPDDAVRDAMRIGPNFTPLIILGNVLQEQVPEKIGEEKQQ